jgi:hypothetical protein
VGTLHFLTNKDGLLRNKGGLLENKDGLLQDTLGVTKITFGVILFSPSVMMIGVILSAGIAKRLRPLTDNIFRHIACKVTK